MVEERTKSVMEEKRRQKYRGGGKKSVDIRHGEEKSIELKRIYLFFRIVQNPQIREKE